MRWARQPVIEVMSGNVAHGSHLQFDVHCCPDMYSYSKQGICCVRCITVTCACNASLFLSTALNSPPKMHAALHEPQLTRQKGCTLTTTQHQQYDRPQHGSPHSRPRCPQLHPGITRDRSWLHFHRKPLCLPRLDSPDDIRRIK
jgi:hypothetical protein